MATTEQFSLRWNNFHSNLTSGFHELFEAAEMVDVTLAVEGHFIQAHKIVLSICSPYFKQMFKVNPCKHPIVILKDVTHENIKDILEFMYMGQVNVLRENLSSFLRTAELLQVKGLTGDDSSETSSRKDEKNESFAENDDDLLQYNQIIDSDVELPPVNYSTPRPPPPSPPQHQQRQQSLSPKPQPPTTNNITTTNNHSKRHRNLLSNVNLKRPKSESNTNQSKINRNETDLTISGSNKEEPEYVETSFNSIQFSSGNSLEQNNDSKDSIRQNIIDSNNSLPPYSNEGNIVDQDPMFYGMVEQKVYVFCPYCCKKFVNRYNLKVHIRDKHDDNPINLNCRICGKTMRNRSCLRVHMYHHRKQELM